MRIGKRERASLADKRQAELVRKAEIARAGSDPGFRLFNQSKIVGKPCRLWDWNVKFNVKTRRENRL